MSLMRALQSGVSGLRNHQLFMDVIGNNIANVNTVGFKVGRITFNEMFAQTIKGTTQPIANQGGTNPIQVGLGMTVGTIDTLFGQGSIEATGQGTDLAIQGDGFFILSDGEQKVYTRAGGFQMDGTGALTQPSNGFKVQGFLANSKGVIEAGTAISDLILPVDQKVPANPTTALVLGGNLNASLEPDGTILSTEQLYGLEDGSSDIEGLYANGSANNSITSMIDGSTTITITDGAGTSVIYTYVKNDPAGFNNRFNSINDLIAEINNDFTGSLTASLNSATGAIEVTDNSGAVNDLTVTSSNGALQNALSNLNGDVFAGTLSSDEFSHVARGSDLLANLRNATGTFIGLTTGDTITINGSVGGSAASPGTLVVSATDTYQDFADLVEISLGMVNNTGVEISADDGALVINGDGGKLYEISDMDITAQTGAGVSITAFDDIFDSSTNNWTQTQPATDVQQSLTTTVFDSLGNSIDLTIVFTKDVRFQNRWSWEATVPEPATVNGGTAGHVEFNQDGSLNGFVFTDGSSTVQISSGQGSNPLAISIDPGELDDFEGITQLSGANSGTIFVTQDGYGMGFLERINIDSFGQINGSFSNGIVKLLGQIALANFSNPGGMMRKEGNLFLVSGNSGDPIVSTAGAGFNSTIVAGALEQSNVDLADEFTKMIIAQRGFQANARTITVSDDMISEVTNLKR